MFAIYYCLLLFDKQYLGYNGDVDYIVKYFILQIVHNKTYVLPYFVANSFPFFLGGVFNVIFYLHMTSVKQLLRGKR